ncbi:nucleotide modification associated domain-containing protein [Blattabacterium cuenoti]|uniref:nucleotide modification associated domain-containing protein n=1 Tax=Blattabacterium cuenoti TaxID=1653831 RepID=UPI00163C18A9|nr:nucleotide modification associated domain-containing protein [Blattabacterium cuenoti]
MLFSFIIKKCENIFLEKLKYYGLSWIILKNYSIIDQILIKIIRIKNINIKKSFSVKEEKIIDTYIDVINYLIIALIKIELKCEKKISNNNAIILYKKKIKTIKKLVKIIENKNCSIDIILNKLLYLRKNLFNISYQQLNDNYLIILVDVIFYYKKNYKKFL